MSKRAVLYLRQSTYREESISLEMQEQSCRDYCARQGYEVVAVEADPGITGRTWKRPAVQRVVQMAEQGRVDVVVLWKWSRLSRSRLDFARAVDTIETAGGRVESSTEPIDVTTASGRFGRGVMAELAVLQSDQIGENWRAIHERRVQQGLPHNGGPRFGYAYSGEGYEIDPVTGPYVEELYRRFTVGESFRSLALWLKSSGVEPLHSFGARRAGISEDRTWTRRTLQRYLDSGFAAGIINFRGKQYPGAHEAIIDDDLWDEYLVRRAKRASIPPRSESSPYLLSALVRCWCGGAMTCSVQGRPNQKSPKYTCQHAVQRRDHTIWAMPAERLHEEVRQWIFSQASLVRALEAEGAAAVPTELPRADAADPAKIKRNLIKLQNRLERIATQYLDDEIPAATYETIKQRTQNEIKEAEEMLREAKLSQKQRPAKILPDIARHWGEMDTETTRTMLRELIHPVLVGPGTWRASEVVIRGLWEEPPQLVESAPEMS